MATPAPAQADDGFLGGTFNFVDGVFKRWMDYERFDAETDLARRAAGQNLDERDRSLKQAAAAAAGPSMLTIGLIGFALVAVVLLVRR
jgi:hypothetical protein